MSRPRTCNHPSLLAAILLLAGASLETGCEPRPTLRLNMRSLPAATTLIEVAVWVSGPSSMSPELPINREAEEGLLRFPVSPDTAASGTASLGVRLHDPGLGSSTTAILGVAARDQAHCFLGATGLQLIVSEELPISPTNLDIEINRQLIPIGLDQSPCFTGDLGIIGGEIQYPFGGTIDDGVVSVRGWGFTPKLQITRSCPGFPDESEDVLATAPIQVNIPYPALRSYRCQNARIGLATRSAASSVSLSYCFYLNPFDIVPCS